MKKKTKKMCKVLSVFLAFLIVVQILPLQVLAENISDAIAHQQFINEVVNNPTFEENTSDIEILYEVEEKRDEYTKVFKKSDGTYTAVMTEEPLHYLNAGVWKEINNSMSLNGNLYTNLNNLFNVEFPESIDSNENLTVEKDGYELSFSVNNIKESSAVVENDIVVSDTNIPVANNAISQTQSSVTYNNVAEDTDLQYIVTPNSIKENIIVSDKDSVKDAYTFTFETNGLNAEKLDDGSVIFKADNDDIKFRIPRPVMTDSNLAVSYDINVFLTENIDGTITLEYSPSSDWTNSSDRIYPITIDPAIMIGDANASWVEDTWVSKNSSNSNAENTNGYNDCAGFVANATSPDHTNDIDCEIYTKLNIDAFKSLGDNIVFTEVQYMFVGYSINGNAIAKEIATPTDFTTVTYNNKPTLDNEVIDYYTSPYTSQDNFNLSFIHFNITKALNDWINGEENNGFAIVSGSENYLGAFYLNSIATTTDSATTTYPTYAIMDYIEMGGYNESFNYHTQSVGKAGTGYVNDFTQQLSVIRDDIYVDDEIMPVTIGMIYDSATYDKAIYLNHDSILAYGNNWTPNYLRVFLISEEDRLTYYTETGAAIDYIRSTDENGKIVFEEKHHNTYNYKLEYHLTSNGRNGYYTINRPDGYVERFDSNGLLISVTNPESAEQKINIVYDERGCINHIIDHIGRKYDYIYDASTMLLSKIKVFSADGTPITVGTTGLPLEVSYTYDENENLIGVTHPTGEMVEYTYENGNMTSMALVDSCRVNFEYDSNGRITVVTEQTYSGTDYDDGNIITYDRLSATQIKITDINNNYEIYHFNNNGTLLYKTDDSQSTITEDINYVANSKFENGLTNWETEGNVTTTSSIINEQSVSAVEFSGGADKENVIYQTVQIDGKKNDKIAVAGWFKGCFSNSSTNNPWLSSTVEESSDPKLFNFTNDRYAQMEVAYQYKITDGDNETTVDEKIIIPFSEHLNDWQYVANEFTLKGDCETVTVLIRYSKNVNNAYASNIELIKNDGYEIYYYPDGQLKGMSLGLRDVISYSYNGNGALSSIEYTNNAYQKTITQIEYNSENKPTKIIENGKTKYSLEYEDNNKTLKKILSSDNRIIRYVDDITGLSGFNNNFFYSIKNEDDNFVEKFAGRNYYIKVYDIIDDIANSIITEQSDVVTENDNGISIRSTQDWYGRRSKNIVEAKEDYNSDTEKVLTKIEAIYGYDNNITYNTINQVKTYTNRIYSESQNNSLPNNNSILYDCDGKGNIVKEYNYLSENSIELRYSYAYDSDNRLIRYNDNVSSPNRSYSFEYDSDGNLASKSTYTYTPLETELSESISIEYYNVAPTSLNDATLIWNGQQLESYERTDDNNITTRVEYSYDENGLMTEKRVFADNVLSETYNYTWAYGQLINQIYTSYENDEETSYAIKYVYDSFNSVQGFIFDHTETYLYLKNLYGDIIGIVDESGNIVVSYEYTPWGVPTTIYNDDENTLSNIIKILPLAYRGCFYDCDTGLYYVENRYYHPKLGTFINFDNTIDSDNTENQGITKENPTDNLLNYWKNHHTVFTDNEYHETYRANIIANYLYNKELSNELSADLEKTDGFIINQTQGIAPQLRYGFSTTGPMGCGWVATYNALKMLGDTMEPHDIIREYEMDGVSLYGILGTNVVAIARFFIDRGYKVDIAFDESFFDTQAEGKEANIIYFTYPNGNGHFVALKKCNGSFIGFNTLVNENCSNWDDSITAFLPYYCTGRMLISFSHEEEASF